MWYITLWQWICKLSAGFALWRPDKLAKMIMYVVGGILGALIVWGIFYKVFIKETVHNQSDVKIQTVQSYYAVPQHRPFYGIDLWGLRLGWEGK